MHSDCSSESSETLACLESGSIFHFNHFTWLWKVSFAGSHCKFLSVESANHLQILSMLNAPSQFTHSSFRAHKWRTDWNTVKQPPNWPMNNRGTWSFLISFPCGDLVTLIFGSVSLESEVSPSSLVFCCFHTLSHLLNLSKVASPVKGSKFQTWNCLVTAKALNFGPWHGPWLRMRWDGWEDRQNPGEPGIQKAS